MDVRKRLGLRLQRLRQERGLSQEELADRSGLHRTYVSGVERGVRNPTISVLDKLAKGLAVTLQDLVTLDD
ncbi:transcriptional regulator [Brevundimonas sp. AAP58]|uniref:helix-turn-helix domain-containing protein n=1 Tax=Brevundimonas sp. AAP58 TaxID=1523422 RepID=UPI0006B9DCF3|nr:helix-turn-helix transcriptional regulator [Brevundimonas sp. AAP58]KPF81151.1 transcriptional regulator [Brevundimonas sp. AAP58]